MAEITMSTARYSQIQRFVSRAFSLLSTLEACIATVAIPALFYFHFSGRALPWPYWPYLLLAIGAVLVLVQAAMLALVQRAQTWAGRSVVAEQEAKAAQLAPQMQGKKGYRGFGPRGKLSKRERIRRGLEESDTPSPRISNFAIVKS